MKFKGVLNHLYMQIGDWSKKKKQISRNKRKMYQRLCLSVFEGQKLRYTIERANLGVCQIWLSEHVHVYTFVCTCMCKGQRLRSGVFLNALHFVFWGRISPWTWRLSIPGFSQVHLSLFPQCWHHRHSLLCLLWRGVVLQIHTQIFILVR